jgi:hypothetical protein
LDEGVQTTAIDEGRLGEIERDLACAIQTLARRTKLGRTCDVQFPGQAQTLLCTFERLAREGVTDYLSDV